MRRCGGTFILVRQPADVLRARNWSVNGRHIDWRHKDGALTSSEWSVDSDQHNWRRDLRGMLGEPHLTALISYSTESASAKELVRRPLPSELPPFHRPRSVQRPHRRHHRRTKTQWSPPKLYQLACRFVPKGRAAIQPSRRPFSKHQTDRQLQSSVWSTRGPPLPLLRCQVIQTDRPPAPSNHLRSRGRAARLRRSPPSRACAKGRRHLWNRRSGQDGARARHA